MKRRKLEIGVIFLITIFLSFGSAHAIGIIDLDTTVNPDYMDSFSGMGDTTGTAKYGLGIDSTSAYGSDYLELVFEGDIFDNVGTPSVITAPAGWSWGLGSSGPDTLLSFDGTSAGDILDPGESIRLTVDYTLSDTYAYYFGTDPNNDPPLWQWSQDGPGQWEQSVSAILTSDSSLPKAMGGNSTIPEPGTLLLLGTGLLGAGFYTRRKRNK